MKPLVKITENIVDKSVSRLGAIQTHIFLNWKNIAGQYADVTFPDKIKFDEKWMVILSCYFESENCNLLFYLHLRLMENEEQKFHH